MTRLILALCLVTLPVSAATFQIGEPITIGVYASVKDSVRIDVREQNEVMEAMLNGEPVAYTEIVEDDGTITLIVTGE